jgi:hypothetical protein
VIYLRPNHESLQPGLHRRSHEDAIGASEVGPNDRIAATHRELNLAGNQRTDDARCAAADDNDLNVEAVFFEKSSFFRDPYTTGGSADGAKTDANFVLRASVFSAK